MEGWVTERMQPDYLVVVQKKRMKQRTQKVLLKRSSFCVTGNYDFPRKGKPL